VGTDVAPICEDERQRGAIAIGHPLGASGAES